MREPRREPVDRPLEERLRLLALELDRELARFQFVDQLDRCSRPPPPPVVALFAGSRPASSPSSSSLARRVNAEKLSPVARAARASPAISPSTAASSSSVGTRRKSERADRGLGPEPAADEDVVGLAPDAALVARGRALEAEVADPVLRAGVGAAVEVEPQARRSASPKRSSRPVDQRAEARLRLGDREVAVRLAGAGDRVAAHRVDVEREADRLERGLRLVEPARSGSR